MKKSVSFLLVLIFVFSAFAPAALAEEDRDAVFAEAMARLFPAEGSHAPAAALELLLPLAESGDAEAQYYCGWIYDFELEDSVENDAVALSWYEKAMESGVLKAYVAAALYPYAESLDECEKLLEQAFSQGFLDLSEDELGADGLFWMGLMHDIGYGLNQDYEKALLYYSKAAERCNVPAMKSCADMYLFALGTEQNYALAARCYDAAAKLGYAPAMYELGLIYQNGLGTEPDCELAMEYFIDAFVNGFDAASSMIEYMKLSGEGMGTYNERAAEYTAHALP
ncbi:MAG: sel1 repeat family protein [Oscillospiraceae bacterium]|nr:sel1 repeat family protein [Oscillospiraceae bacterium]